MSDSTTKRCTRCGVDKPLADFSKGARFKDGLQPYCKACMRAYRAERAAETGEHVDRRQFRPSKYAPGEAYQATLARNRKRRRTPEFREYERSHVNARYQDDPEYRERRKGHSRKSRPQSNRGRRARYQSDPTYRQQRRAIGNEANRKYRQSPRGHALNHAHARAYRARKHAATGSHTAAEWDVLCVRYDHRCLACGERRPLTEDHIIPIVKGGSDDISNIQPLCKSCNSKKGTNTTDYRVLWG